MQLLLRLVLVALLFAAAGACSSDGNNNAVDGGPALDVAEAGVVDARSDVGGNDVAADVVAADLTADTEPPPPPPELGDLTMVINLGDSIAAGQGVKNDYATLLMNNDDGAYPGWAGKDLTAKYAGISLSDRAWPGATSKNLVDQALNAPANPQGNTLVLISIGGNDLLNNYTMLMDPIQTKQVADHVIGNIKKAVAHFKDKARYPGEVFVLALNVYEMTDGLGTIPPDEPVVEICDKLRAVGPLVGDKLVDHFEIFNVALEGAFAEEGILLVDAHQAFLGHGFNYKDKTHPHYDAGDPTLWLQYDCIHPNQAGHQGIRKLIWKRLFAE